MLEYMAAELPIITTKVGARGLELKNGSDVIIADIENFLTCIEELLENKAKQKKLRNNGRKLVEKKYDWSVIGKQQRKILNNF